MPPNKNQSNFFHTLKKFKKTLIYHTLKKFDWIITCVNNFYYKLVTYVYNSYYKLVLVITCLAEEFKINCPSTFFKI